MSNSSSLLYTNKLPGLSQSKLPPVNTDSKKNTLQKNSIGVEPKTNENEDQNSLKVNEFKQPASLEPLKNLNSIETTSSKDLHTSIASDSISRSSNVLVEQSPSSSPFNKRPRDTSGNNLKIEKIASKNEESLKDKVHTSKNLKQKLAKDLQKR